MGARCGSCFKCKRGGVSRSEGTVVNFTRANISREKLSSYRGTSLTRKRTPLGPYRRLMTRVLGGSWGVGRFFVSEVTL